jgi:hypothetical protein
MRRQNLMFVLPLLAVAVMALVACSDAGPAPWSPIKARDGGTSVEGGSFFEAGAPPTGKFQPKPVPELNTTAKSNSEPFYFYLFTHTEDPFNHELSEERYLRLVPEVAKVAKENPDAHLSWTIEFMGSDANTVAERNPQTGVVDLIKEHMADGVIEIGYHAHHDPNYQNRPQTQFTNNSSWEELVSGMDSWVSCRKDLAQGGCVSDTGGGVVTIQDIFGEAKLVSGLFTYNDMETDGPWAVHALRKYLPGRLLGFGFSDHSPKSKDPTRQAALKALMTLMTPSVETSGSLVWIDDVIRMHDGDPLNDVTGVGLKEGKDFLAKKLAKVDRARPHVLNVGIASKYIYTPKGMSPTQYGYLNTAAPQLKNPLSRQEIETNYQTAKTSLQYLAKDVVRDNPGTRFVGNDDLIQMVAPAEYWQVSKDKLDVLARWLLLKWTDRPPAFVSDGTDFYSLRDLFILLAKAIASDYPQSVELTFAYGPFEEVMDTDALGLDAADLKTAAKSITDTLAPTKQWQLTPKNTLTSTYQVGGQSLTVTQLLYAMAQLYASTVANTPLNTFEVPATQSMPETLAIMAGLSCTDRCQGTIWSLKPARIRAPK